MRDEGKEGGRKQNKNKTKEIRSKNKQKNSLGQVGREEEKEKEKKKEEGGWVGWGGGKDTPSALDVIDERKHQFSYSMCTFFLHFFLINIVQ